jgi:hypothetical protein
LYRQVPRFEERHEANTARGDAQRRLARLLTHPHDGGFNLREDDVRVVQQQKLVEELTIAAQRINARYERTSAASQVALRTRTAVEAWLKNRPGGTTIEDWVGPDPKPAKGEDILTTVSRLERRTRELRADLHRVESASFPTAGRANPGRSTRGRARPGLVCVERIISGAPRMVR